MPGSRAASRPVTSYARVGREKPRSDSSPTGCGDDDVLRRGVHALADQDLARRRPRSHSRAARFVTLPIAA